MPATAARRYLAAGQGQHVERYTRASGDAGQEAKPERGGASQDFTHVLLLRRPRGGGGYFASPLMNAVALAVFEKQPVVENATLIPGVK